MNFKKTVKVKKASNSLKPVHDSPETAAHIHSKRSKLANRLSAELEKSGINYSTFARMMNKYPSEITKWFTGRHNFTTDTLFEIEARLNITLVMLDPPPDKIPVGRRIDFSLKVTAVPELGSLITEKVKVPRKYKTIELEPAYRLTP